MAAVGRPRPLQLLRGTWKPRQSGGVPGQGACAMVAYSSPPEPATPTVVDTYPDLGFTLASSTEHASSLPGCALCRHSSAIRTGCANERPSGSEEGVVSNHDPYSDRQLTRLGVCAIRPVFSFACPQKDGYSYSKTNCSHHQVSEQRLPNEKGEKQEHVHKKGIQTSQALFRLGRPYQGHVRPIALGMPTTI